MRGFPHRRTYSPGVGARAYSSLLNLAHGRYYAFHFSLLRPLLIITTKKNTDIMAEHNDIGRWGEDIAARYMAGKGWYIRHRDWRWEHKDIDLVCIDEDDTTLLFVEVKTRTTLLRGNPIDAVDSKKRRNIVEAASAYRRLYKKENRHVRFDIISIIGSPDTNWKIEHIENAFTAFDVFEDNVSALHKAGVGLSF